MWEVDGKCKGYETRPKICRVDKLDFGRLDKDEYLMARCELFRYLRKLKKDFGASPSVNFIIEKIARSGLS